MKKLFLICGIVLASIATPVFASQFCAANVTVTGGQYVPPAGWDITQNTLPKEVTDATLAFGGASFNYDHKVGERNGNRISCYYSTADNKSHIEITSEQTAVEPVGTRYNHWEEIFIGGDACTWPTISTMSCPWDFN